MRHRILTVMAVFCCLSDAAAVNRYFSHLTMDDGLSHNCVNAIVQDSDGFIWMGTRNGLNRYDGSRIRTFDCSDALTGHGNNNISALYADPQTGLWCGTDKGVYVWSKETETFREFVIASDEGESVRDWVAAIGRDSYGNIWIIAPNQGVFRYDGAELFFYDIFSPECLYVRKNGQVWIGTYSSGIYVYDREKDDFANFATDSAGGSVLGEYIYSMCEWGQMMVIAVHDGNLRYLDLKSMTFGTMDTPQIHGTVLRSIRNFDNDLWVCTHEGIFVIDGQDRSVTHFEQNHISPFGLSDKTCSVLCQDSEGGIWVGTLLNGVNYSAAKGFIIDKYILYDEASSVLFSNIKTLAEAPDGKIWVGTENEGICSFDPVSGETKALERKYCESSKLLNTLGSSVSRDGRFLWTGFFKRGFTKVDMVTGGMEYIDPADLGIRETSIYSFCRDSRNNIWIGTASGVWRKCPGDRAFSIVDTLRTVWAFDIMEDSRRNVWFASLGGGVYRYEPVHDRFLYFSHDPDDASSLSVNSVSGIMEDSRGIIWFSTDRGGLSGYRYETQSFENYSVGAGFPDDVTYRALEDQSGTLWIGTNKGLLKFDPETGYTRTFTKKDGLLGDQFNYHSSLKTKDGRLWFGSMEGLVSFDPLQVEDDRDNIPRICFTGIVVNNEKQKVGEKGSVLDESLFYTERIILRHDQSNVRVDFADVRFSSVSNTEYFYMMEGTGNEWIRIDGEKSVSFARLAPGEYRLHIKGVSVNGHTNTAEKILAITVRQPWWTSLTAKFLYAFLVFAAGAAVIDYLYKRKKKQMEVQRNMFEMEKEKEVYSAKVDFFNEIAHEIRTPLTLIKGPLEDVISMNEDSRLTKSLKTVSTNTDRLLELVNQLLDFKNVDSQRLQLDFVRFDVPEQLRYITDRFEPTMVKSGKVFSLDTGTADFRATADKEAFTKIISNLLTNAIKYSERKIDVKLSVVGKMFSVRVTSDGERIPLHLSEKIFEPFYRIENPDRMVSGTGIGLPMARSLAQMHKGHLYLDTAASGNSFVLTLPMEQDRVIDIKMSETVDIIAADDNGMTVLESREEADIKSPSDDYVVLIVEDNASVRRYLAEKLSESCTVLTAENGVKALDMLSNRRTDIVISDIMMPEMDGLELCRRLKADEVLRSIPVVFLTAKNDTNSKVEGLRIGAEAFIEKPFSFAYLKALIFSIMDNRRKEREDFTKKPMVKLSNIKMNATDEEFMNRVVAVIEAEITSDDLNVEMLADRLSMTRATLLRKIRNITGSSVVDFIKVIRLKKAAELLKSGQMTITQVCYAVGFGSSSYFAKLFYKQFGIKPKEFEKQDRNEN